MRPQCIDYIADGHVVLAQLLSTQQYGQLPLEGSVDVHRRDTVDRAKAIRQHVFGQSRDLGVGLRRRRKSNLDDGLLCRVEAP